MIDISSSTINITLWGPTTKKEGKQLHEMYHLKHVVVLAIKNGRVTKYNRKVISTLERTHLFINPRIKEEKQLTSWFEQNGTDVTPSNTRPLDGPLLLARKKIVDIEQKTTNVKQTFQCTLKATVQYIKKNHYAIHLAPLS